MNSSKLDIAADAIQTFCEKWQITELSLFGSVLRDDFRPDSDIDVLVSFTPDAPWTLVDLVTMQHELEDILNRDVDLVEKHAVETSDNWIRRNEILTTAQAIYSRVHEPS